MSEEEEKELMVSRVSRELLNRAVLIEEAKENDHTGKMGVL